MSVITNIYLTTTWLQRCLINLDQSKGTSHTTVKSETSTFTFTEISTAITQLVRLYEIVDKMNTYSICGIYLTARERKNLRS